MTQLTHFGTSPFDILFRDFFKSEEDFAPFNDIACVGLTKKDIDLTIEGDILRVEYKKDKGSAPTEYIQRNIAKRAFNFGWRISRRFDLSKLDAKLQNGLLHIFAPLTEDSKPKSVTIK
jgi:HSP20 family molecular chaperone IbpA